MYKEHFWGVLWWRKQIRWKLSLNPVFLIYTYLFTSESCWSKPALTPALISVVTSYLATLCVCVCVSVHVCLITQLCLTLCNPITVAHQAPLSRQENCSGLPCSPPGDLPNPGIEPRSPTLQAGSLQSELPGKPTWPLWSALNPRIYSQKKKPAKIINYAFKTWIRKWHTSAPNLLIHTHFTHYKIQNSIRSS